MVGVGLLSRARLAPGRFLALHERTSCWLIDVRTASKRATFSGYREAVGAAAAVVATVLTGAPIGVHIDMLSKWMSEVGFVYRWPAAATDGLPLLARDGSSISAVGIVRLKIAALRVGHLLPELFGERVRLVADCIEFLEQRR